METKYTAEQAVKILETSWGEGLCRVTKAGKVQIREIGKAWRSYKSGYLSDHEVQWHLAREASAYRIEF